MKVMQKKAFLYRYITSFILILIIPMVCLLLYITNSVKSDMQKDLIVNNYNNTIYIHNSVDSNIQKLENLALLTMNNPDLKSYFLEKSYYNYYQAVNTLKYIEGTNELLNMLIIYNKSNDLVVSNLGTMPKQYFGKKVLSTSLDNKIQLKEFVETVVQPIYIYGYVNIPGIGERRCILYLYPTSSDFDQIESIIIMIIDVQNIIDLFGEQYNNASGSVFIMDKNNNTVVQYGNENEKIPKNYLQNINKPVNESEIFLYQNNKYCISSITSLKTDWKYISIISFSIASRDLVNHLYISYLIFFILLIVCSLGIYISIRLNYNPLFKLKKQMEPIIESKSLNEVETISTAINSLINNVDKMSSCMKGIQPIVHNYLIQQIIGRKRIDNKSLVDLRRQFSFNFDKNKFMVGIIKLKNMDNGETISDFVKAGNEYIKTYYLSIPMNDLLLIVFNFEENEYEKIINSLADIIECIKQKNKSDIHVSLGRVTELDNISKSYFEAYMVEMFREIGKQKHDICCFNDIIRNSHNPTSGFCPGYIRDLELNVLRADVEYIAKFPSMIIQQISSNTLPEYYINYIIYEMIRVIIFDFVDDVNQSVILNKIWDFIYDNSPVFSVDKLEEVITFICSTLIQNIQQNPATVDPTLNDILQYINDNYNKPDFSIQMTADNFNMSPSWLSHYFKSNMHITLTEFVQNKRIKYAQQLIQNDECSISKISEQLGYCNVYSFVRAFKKAVKMTPNQYREVIGNSKTIES